MNNVLNSLCHSHKLVAFTVDSAEMQKNLNGIVEDFCNHLDDIAEVDDNCVSETEYEPYDKQVVTVGITDTTYGITYKVKYAFYVSIDGEGHVNPEYVGYDDYYGDMYETNVDLDWCTINCYNIDGEIGADIEDVTIEGDKESMDYFNNRTLEERINLFKSIKVWSRHNGENTDFFCLSDYVFENVSDLY